MDATPNTNRPREGLSRALVLAIPLLMVSLSLIGFVCTQWAQSTAGDSTAADGFGDLDIALGDFESSEESWSPPADIPVSSAGLDDEAPPYSKTPGSLPANDFPQLSVPRMEEEGAGVITAGSEGLMNSRVSGEGPLLDLAGNSAQVSGGVPTDLKSAPPGNPVWLEGTIESISDVPLAPDKPLQQVLLPPPLRQ